MPTESSKNPGDYRILKTVASDALLRRVGIVFTDRRAIDATSADVVVAADRVGDVATAMEHKAFEAAFRWKPLRFVVRLFFVVYDIGRWLRIIPSASEEPWYAE